MTEFTLKNINYAEFLSVYRSVIRDIILKNWDCHKVSVDDWIIYVDKKPEKNVCLAFLDKKIVGVCIWNPSEIYSLHVEKEHQNRGIGSLLLQDKLFENQKVHVLVDNTKAMRFYERHGFSVSDRTSVKVGSVDFHEFVLTKQINGVAQLETWKGL